MILLSSLTPLLDFINSVFINDLSYFIIIFIN